MKKLLSSSLTFILAIILIIVTFVASYIAFKVPYAIEKKLISCEQNSSVNNDNSYCVSVITNKYVFETKKYIKVSAGENNDNGNYINYPDPVDSEGNEQTSKEDKVEWAEESVKITTPVGYEIFINKDLYSSP
jgi:hypothetical protein